MFMRQAGECMGSHKVISYSQVSMEDGGSAASGANFVGKIVGFL